MIITFYSYKGGCGRTMAMANLAVLLAAENKKVLAVDFDLEAPGLWRYFHDFDPTLAEQDGLLDLLSTQKDDNAEPHWQDYIREVYFPGGSLSLLTSGKLDEEYAARVLGLDWATFFRNADGAAFFETLRNDWRAAYDYVLVDSRTGVTDTGGICTIQLPDMIVPVCVPNFQSLDGAANVIASAQNARINLAYDRPPALVLPLLSRFDSRTEYESARQWLDIAADRLAPFYDDWLPKGITARQALEWTKLPYVAYFSFGESLPVLGSDLSDPDSLGYAFKRLSNLIRSDLAEIGNLVTSERPEPASSIESARWDFFVSYAQSDRAWAEWIAWNLEEVGYRILLQAWDFAAGSNWTAALLNGMSGAARIVVVLSQEYLQSVYGDVEWQAAFALDPDAKARVIAVRVADCPRPGLLASVVSIDLFARDQEEAEARLRSAIGKGRSRSPFEAGSLGSGRDVDRPPQFPGTVPAKRPSDPTIAVGNGERTARSPEEFDYDVFISYCAEDEPVAKGIQNGLTRIGRRLGQIRALRVRTDLGGRDDLWGSTINVMDRSRWLIVVLSRRAAASEWVDKEVAYWLQHRGPDHLMLVVAEGHLQWDEQNRRLDPHGSDVALPVLTEPWAYPSEPFYIDVSQDAPWDIKAPTFRDKVSHLAAPIHGKSKYELASDDVREQRGSRRLRLAVLVTLVVLTIVSLTVAVVAVRQAQELLRLRNHAEARHLVSEGGSELIGLHDNVWTQQEGASMDALKGRSVDSGVHRIVSSDSSRWAPASRRAGIPNFPAGTSTATAADWPPSAVYDLKLLGGKSF